MTFHPARELRVFTRRLDAGSKNHPIFDKAHHDHVFEPLNVAQQN